MRSRKLVRLKDLYLQNLSNTVNVSLKLLKTFMKPSEVKVFTKKVSENHLKIRNFYPILLRFFPRKSAFRCFSCNIRGLGRRTVTRVGALESSVFGESFQHTKYESQAALKMFLKPSEVKVFTKK